MNTNFVSPLSLSRLLKERGVKQNSFFRHFGKDGIHSKEEVISFGYEESWEDHWKEGISVFTLSELPDVFRQVFDNSRTSMEESRTEARIQFDSFMENYWDDPASAWSTLEETIKSLR